VADQLVMLLPPSGFLTGAQSLHPQLVLLTEVAGGYCISDKIFVLISQGCIAALFCSIGYMGKYFSRFFLLPEMNSGKRKEEIL
jgi:hypothetical protein